MKKYYDAPCYSPYYAKGSVGTVVKAEGADEDELIEEEEENVVTEITRSKSGVLEELNGEDTRNMLIYVADKVMGKKEYLTEIDSAIGDGDHGIGMYGGMKKAKKRLLKMAGETDVYKLI